jgi:hypothetical protein
MDGLDGFSSHTAELFDENYKLLVHGMLTRDSAYSKFAAYFIEQYPDSSGGLWAAFGRIGSDVTCNMHIESYHRYAILYELA